MDCKQFDLNPDLDEEAEETHIGSHEEAAYTYSYDRTRGANRGSEILSLAVARAEVILASQAMQQRFIEQEYEVVTCFDGLNIGSDEEDGYVLV